LIQAATPPTSPLFPYTTLFRSTKAPPFSQNPSLRDFSHYTSLYPPVQADGYGQSVTGLQKEGKTKRRFLTKPPPASTMGTGEPDMRPPVRRIEPWIGTVYSFSGAPSAPFALLLLD